MRYLSEFVSRAATAEEVKAAIAQNPGCYPADHFIVRCDNGKFAFMPGYSEIPEDQCDFQDGDVLSWNPDDIKA